MTDRLEGLTAKQHRELREILAELSGLWAELTKAAAADDEDRVEVIQRQIAQCRERVDAIKRAGTRGSA